jgi:hypothetical protein
MAQSAIEKRILDGSLWEEFCDSLKACGKLLEGPDLPTDAFNRALGYRALTHFLRSGLEAQVDFSDPEFPDFYRLADETKKMLNDNPDNFYQNCVIDPRFEYEITGTRGTVPYWSIGTKGGLDASGMSETGNIDSTQIAYEPDGTFRIHVSVRRRARNWLPMTDATKSLVVRQTFGRREQEEITRLRIRCLNPQRVNNTLRVEQFGAALLGAANFVRNTMALGNLWQSKYKAEHLNQLPEHDQQVLRAAGGDPNIHYYQSYWKLAHDEALLVHLRDIPECDFWNLQLANAWMESFDFRFFRCSIQKYTAHYETDGSVVIVVAHEDPGPAYPNWLDTFGHGEGGMLGRYVHAKSFPKEMPARVVKLAALRGR